MAKPALAGLERTLALARRHVASASPWPTTRRAPTSSRRTRSLLAEVAWDVASGEAALRAFAHRVVEHRH